jgi:uncharacterized phiE125 gp8 family phage protein
VPVQLVQEPADEPLTLVEAKDHLRLEIGDDDPQVEAAILGARQWVEEHCWRGLVTQTWELILDAFPGEDEIALPKGNLTSISSITYVDGDGATQTLAPTEYQADTASEPGRVHLPYGKSWPGTRCQWDAVKIRYVVGWAAADVPGPIKNALKLLVSQLYEHRTPEVIGPAIAKVEFSVKALLAPYRLARF